MYGVDLKQAYFVVTTTEYLVVGVAAVSISVQVF